MLGIDVGDDRDRPVESKQKLPSLSSASTTIQSLSEPSVGPVAIDDAAVDLGRVEPASVEHRRDHRRRGGFPVRAGDRDGLLHAHQLGEHFGSADDG